MPVYPRNAPFSMRRVARASERATNLSEMTTGTHNGTHVDTQLHVKNGAKGEWNLQKLVGKCAVLDCTGVAFGKGVEAGDLEGKKFAKGGIVLLKTRNSGRGFEKFRQDYVYLSPSGADFLKKAGASAVGIDSVAVQKFHSGNQLVHRSLLLAGIPVIEGLDLKGVPAGRYEFFCLPLKMEGDGLPARAILVKR
ncbi:Kynurenine formamidase [uncultured archaeon]|nr:Kynurenine formamidase [uncultured archaeon]